jgi:NitT/TauT family transport system ATP-binding protein
MKLPAPTSAFVSIDDLALRYADGTQALVNIDAQVTRSEFVAIVGPSGCGKSTLLKLLAGLLEASAGTLDIAGSSPAAARAAGHDTAYVFQSPTLLPWRSLRDNVALPLELRGMDRSAREQRADLMIRLVGLQEFTSARPAQLSGGMQMRVSLARALVTNPALILLDEPFGALDEITRQYLNEELLRLWLARRWTAVLVTHNVQEAVFLAQRVLVMGPRPGTIIGEYAVDFPYPRLPELRADPRFAALAARISTRLREALA